MRAGDKSNKTTLVWVSKGRRKDYAVIAFVGNKEFLSSCKWHTALLVKHTVLHTSEMLKLSMEWSTLTGGKLSLIVWSLGGLTL